MQHLEFPDNFMSILEFERVEEPDRTPKVEKLVEAWRDMTASEMRLRCGEMTAQEIRTVRAVLNQILLANSEGCRSAND